MYLNSLLEYPLVLECTKPSYLYPDLSNVLIANSLVTCNQTVASPECFKCGQQHENKQCTVEKPKCANCKGEHPPSSKTCPKKIEKLLVMKKVLVEKCTPQQARVEIKTQLKPANKPKGKVAKVTIPSDTENTNNIVLFLALILGKLPKMNDPKTKIEYLTELAVKIFDIKLNVEHILTKYLSLY